MFNKNYIDKIALEGRMTREEYLKTAKNRLVVLEDGEPWTYGSDGTPITYPDASKARADMEERYEENENANLDVMVESHFIRDYKAA